MTLALAALHLDVELQPRETIDLDLVAEYAEAIEAGAIFPPVVAFQNGAAELLLADGWHRRYAHAKAGREVIKVEVRKGDRMDALRHSLSANATHGRQRSEATLKRAYDLAVKHELVDPASVDAVRQALQCSTLTQREKSSNSSDP